MKKTKINEIEYEIVTDNRDGFDEEELLKRVTDYFYEYDYIFGDWAYGKLRLKGFNDKKNKKVNEINNIEKLDEYIEKNCAYGCRYFLIKKSEKR